MQWIEVRSGGIDGILPLPRAEVLIKWEGGKMFGGIKEIIELIENGWQVVYWLDESHLSFTLQDVINAFESGLYGENVSVYIKNTYGININAIKR